MPKGKPITEDEACEILQYAALTSIKEAGAEFGISPKTVYNLTYKYPDGWKSIRAALQPVVEIEVRDMWNLSRGLVVQQLEAEVERLKVEGAEPRIKIGELSRIMQVCGIQFERHARMSTFAVAIDDILKAIREGDARVINQFSDIMKSLPEKAFEEILEKCQSTIPDEAPDAENGAGGDSSDSG